MQLLVLGCGVSGLSCAVRLQEAGFEVTIRARERTPHTTSDIAAAVFYPYRADPPDRVLAWGRASLRAFGELAHDPASGVSWLELVELFESRVADPWWKSMLPDSRRTASHGFADGYAVRVPRIDMPVYMPYLERRFLAGGGGIESGDATDLEALSREHPIVVHCTGLGARELARDLDVFPIRGQVVRVREPSLQRCLVHDSTPRELAYIVPRSTDVVLGGTAIDHDWDTRPDPDTERRILERCARLAPGIERAEIVGRAVGLRPGRPTVRLELERLAPGRVLVHNYGHGGSGVTLSWGCADEVVRLVREVAASRSPL